MLFAAGRAAAGAALFADAADEPDPPDPPDALDAPDEEGASEPVGFVGAGFVSALFSPAAAGAVESLEAAASAVVAAAAGTDAASSPGAERESVLYQPDPLKTMAVAAMSRRGTLAQRGQAPSGGSLKPPTASNVCPQWSQW